MTADRLAALRDTLRGLDLVWTIPNGRLEVFGNRGPQSGAPR